MTNAVDTALRKALQDSLAAGISLNRISSDSSVSYPTLHKFVGGMQEHLNSQSVARLFVYYGIEMSEPIIQNGEKK